jgi:ankyrin repeat protein
MEEEINLFEYIRNDKISQLIQLLKDTNITNLDVNTTDINGNYLLSYAIMNNNLDLINALIARGATLDITDSDGKSILFVPIKYHYNKVLSILLEFDQSSIGVSLTEIKDREGFIPLHYAIVFKNIEAVKVLLQYDSNVNIKNNNGYNSLQLAISSKLEEICKIILNYNIDINSKINNGQNALHLACNHKMNSIANILIKKGIDIDAQEFDHNFSPIMFCFNANNKIMFVTLLKLKCNLNLQDILGNTLLHYLIIDDNNELFNILYDAYTNKECSDINFNIFNYESNIPLHIALKYKHLSFVSKLISGSNVNFQNMQGMTAIHYFTEYKIWMNYASELEKKKIDMFVYNVEAETPVDYIPKENINEFIELVAQGYLYTLRHYKFDWSTSWERLCINPVTISSLSSQDKIEIQEIGRKLLTDLEKNQDICKDVILQKINNIYDSYLEAKKQGKRITRDKVTYPKKQISSCSSVSACAYETNNYCTYTGTTLDILIGLIYILRKYRNATSTVDEHFIENNKLCDYYKSIGSYSRSRCEFLNFEIIWINKIIHLSTNFIENFKRAIERDDKRFIIIPVGIEMNKGSHSNYLIFDKDTLEMERFEPYGSDNPYMFDYEGHILDERLKKIFTKEYKNIKYIRPIDYEPKVGFQFLESGDRFNKQIGDPGGFCAVWALWYVEQRLIYADVDRSVLIKKILKNIKLEGTSIKNMIRNYSTNVTDLRDEIFSNTGMTINNWLNEQYTDEQLITIIKEITDLITEYK